MIVNRTSGLARQVYRTLTRLWVRDVYLVTGTAKWALYWVGYHVTAYLKEQQGISAHLNVDLGGLRSQIIHFINRHAYLNGTFRSLHPSNHVFLTWLHGDPADPNPNMQRLFAVLPEAAEHVHKLIISCQISRQVLIELGIPEIKIVTIPLGVDLARFVPPTLESRLSVQASLGIPKDAICIGSFQKDGVGWEEGLEPKLVKGPDVFLEVVANLAARYNNLLVLLTGPARGYVKQGLGKLGIPHIHHFLSDYHDIVRYYQALDLYIIPSRSEGGPKALLEGWATGVPVVSTRVGMPADLIKHRENGMLAEVEDVRSLTSHAVELIEDVALRDKCRRRALEDVKRYDWPLIAERYYRELYQPFLRIAVHG
jgi:glycosyltransferase involved in cell wall biosynthesis